MNLKEIREWQEEKRKKRINELGVQLREQIKTSGTIEQLEVPESLSIIDETIIIFLETCRSDFKDHSSLEVLSEILKEYGGDSESLGLVSLRFFDTENKVGGFKNSRGLERDAIKEDLTTRGII